MKTNSKALVFLFVSWWGPDDGIEKKSHVANINLVTIINVHFSAKYCEGLSLWLV